MKLGLDIYGFNSEDGAMCVVLLPTGSEERGVLGVGSIPVAILSCSQDMKTIAL